VERSTAGSRGEGRAGATVLPDLDRAVFHATLDEAGDASLGPQLAQLFEQESRGAPGRLRDAIARGDAEAVARAAHGVKGSSATLGAARVAALALDLERTAREARMGVAAALVAELDGAVEDAARALHDTVGA
jgi:HPt (histidine-containing phosphotransfer) domain-containing protein